MKAKKILSCGLLLAAAGLTACSPKVDFDDNPVVAGLSPQPVPSPGVDTPVVCQPGETTVNKPSKVIFVVDQSGSNVNPHSGGNPSDKEKKFRSKVMLDFFNKHSGKAHLGWSLVGFQGVSAFTFIGSNEKPKFAKSVAEMAAAFIKFKETGDKNGTPYKAAFKMVEKLIKADLASAPKDTQYLIAFLTDGYPTDYCKGEQNNIDCGNSIKEDELDKDVKNLVQVAGGHIQFSSVYYGPEDSEAANRLERLAGIAGGQFVDTNKTTNIKLDDVLTIPKPICE